MKGVIAIALKEMVVEKFGPEKWKGALVCPTPIHQDSNTNGRIKNLDYEV